MLERAVGSLDSSELIVPSVLRTVLCQCSISGNFAADSSYPIHDGTGDAMPAVVKRRWVQCLVGQLLLFVVLLATAGQAGATGTASISGSLTDAQGSPITSQDVCVEAFLVTGQNYVWYASQTVATDSSGNYTITGLEAGTYKVGFADCAQLYGQYSQYGSSSRNDVAQYYSGTTKWEEASLVVLSAGGAKTGIDARLEAATTISGHVYSSADDSVPMPLECVFADSEPYEYGPLTIDFANLTSNDGSYVAPFLHPGLQYLVEFYDCEHAKENRTQLYDDAYNSQSATPVAPTVASPGENVDAHMTAGGAISGTVTDADGTPITSRDICVNAEGSSSEYSPGQDELNDYGSTTTDESGNYVIGGLAAGRYFVFFGDCQSSARNDVPQYYGGGSSYEAANMVTVSLGATSASINAALAPATSISGTVYGSPGTATPLGSICVDADPAEATVPGGYETTGSDGTYTLKHLTPGVGYKVAFYDCGSGRYRPQIYNGVELFSEGTILTPTLEDPLVGIDAHLNDETPQTQITGGPANHAATNATTASFAFTSTAADAWFECDLDGSGFYPCLSPFTSGTLTEGTHTFAVRSGVGTTTDPNPPSVTWTVAPSSPTSTSQGTVSAGGTMSSDPGQAPSPSQPIVADATLPTAGTVTMTKEPAITPSGNGYTVFGQQLDIAATAPDGTTPISGTTEHPITLAFQIDGSAIPAGTNPATITVLRNGVPAPDCTGAAGTAAPDPCIAARTPIAGGGVELTVLTTHCSVWNFASTASVSGPAGGTGIPQTTAGPVATETHAPVAPVAPGNGVLGSSIAAGAIVLGRPNASGAIVKLPISCRGSNGSSCQLTMTLAVVESVRRGRIVSISAGANAKRRTVVVGHLALSLLAGQRKTVAIGLNATGARLLRQRRQLKVALEIAQPAMAQTSALRSYTLTLKTAKGSRDR